MKKGIFSLLILNFLALGVTLAHGDLHEQIQQVTKAIEERPDSAYLYFKRGKLYFHHEDFRECLADLQRAQSLGHHDLIQQLIFAKAHHQLGQPELALSYIDLILADHPHHVNALKTKGRISFDRGNYQTAALAFEQVIAHSIRSIPENYMDACRAWELLGTEQGQNRAIAILEKGIEALGPIISLYEKRTELLINYGRLEEAIAAQQAIIDISQRKEAAYYRMAEIHLMREDHSSAAQYLQLSRSAFESLPQRIQQTTAMTDLLKDINKHLQQLRQKK
ncbi:tetratricopeptide repeat protein [Flavilitoribacter nigricans]|uniref:Uncharacterized protein n=1 Tax=Flavilitoribacter nigricans (strain ATCC 23147 / DSM 23189 / NBRC 102662 / NCIMB 1420 / SS-2) TaxID=1122177 RepID=A0A2D0NAE7_FLAN2|nr:tetratricopeptide repeat protein [Flavilitoribacter nigricans]PHN04753.1 hypothetical protein CRP01_19755 [Flavilitoribacter nigricans DSM 23189 = NBRC 102662]